MVLPELGGGNGQLVRGWYARSLSAGSASTPATCVRRVPETTYPVGHERQHLGHQDAGLLGAEGGHIKELIAELYFDLPYVLVSFSLSRM